MTKTTPILADAAPPPRMRGGMLHNHLVGELRAIFAGAGWLTFTEYPLDLDDGRRDFVDLLTLRNGVTIACEVETSTRNVRSNVIKAHALGLELWIVVPNRKTRVAVNAAAKTMHGIGQIQILALNEVRQRLTNYSSSFSSANRVRKNEKTAPPAGDDRACMTDPLPADLRRLSNTKEPT